MNSKVKVCFMVVIIVAIAGLSGIYFGTAKSRNYKKAVIAMHEEKYDIAIGKFQSLDTYRDSKTLYEKCIVQKRIVDDKEKSVFNKIPEMGTFYVGDAVDWDQWITEYDISVSDNISKDIAINIDDNEIDFSRPGNYSLKLSASDEAGNVSEEKISIIIKYHPTYAAYLDAVNLEESMIIKDSTGSHSYKNIHISQDEIGHIEDGSIYRSIAQQLDGYYIFGEKYYGNWGEDVFPLVFGTDKPAAWRDIEEQMDDVSLFISSEYPLGEIMNKLESLSCTSGDFDYLNGIFDFTISDLKIASEEMGITQEMLGYILAQLEEYAPQTQFEKNSYSFKLVVAGRKEDKTILDRDDFIAQFNYGDAEDQLERIGYDQGYRYFFSDRKRNINEIPENELVLAFSTHRGITLGGSFNATLFKYGQGNVNGFNKDNVLYEALIFNEDKNVYILDECTKYMSYNYGTDKGQIIFLFNNEDAIVMIIYTNIVAV